LSVFATVPCWARERKGEEKKEFFFFLRGLWLYVQSLSFEEQIQVMHRTVVYISMHGASMANVVLLRRGAAVVEMMPYMWHYGGYKRSDHILYLYCTVHCFPLAPLQLL